MAASTLPDLLRAVEAAPPRVALVLGSGLGAVAAAADIIQCWPFSALPLPALPTVAGHHGRLVHARWSGQSALIFEGRLHFYEGHSWDDVAAPIRLAAGLGVKTLVLTNAAGGIRGDLDPGNLMLIRRHLKMNRPHWWRRGCKQAEPIWYSDRLNDRLQKFAVELGIDLKAGVYGAVTGPSYETPAEIRAYAALGVNAIGMSTTHEAETAAGLGLEVVGISCITNKGAGLTASPPHHEEVLQEARRAADCLGRLLAAFLNNL
jgi:purine-nucleoside phosphorylase